MQIGAMPIGATVVVDLEHFGHLRAEVRHHTKGVVGLQFLHDATAEKALSRWLMTTRPERRQIRYPCNLEAKIVTNNRELDCVIVENVWAHTVTRRSCSSWAKDRGKRSQMARLCPRCKAIARKR